MDSQTEDLLRNAILSEAGNLVSAPNFDVTVDDNLSLSDIIKEAYNEAVDIYNKEHPSSKIDIYLGDEKVEDISHLEELLENNHELMELIHNILKNKPIGYLNIIDNRLKRLESDIKSSKLVDLNERPSNQNSPNSFYEIFEGANISIDDLYVEPPYKRVIYDGKDVKSETGDKDFISHCENLLESQQVLYIYGPYGYGKTFLTKKLLSSISNGEKGYTLYINSRDLQVTKDAYKDVFKKNAIESLINKYGRLYIFIDSFEDILFALEKGQSTLNYYVEFNRLCNRFSSLYFIINERIPDGITYEDAFLPFACHLNRVKEIIKLESFSSPHIAKWIDNYTFYNHQIPFSLEDIQKANKNLKTSLKNPLLLLMMAISNEPISPSQSWFNLFETFIEKTIKGKSELENNQNFFLLTEGVEIYSIYKGFIFDVANQILKHSHPKLDLEQFDVPDFFLDPNNLSFSIINTDIQDIINETFKDYVPENKKKELYKYLNCYFFECNSISKEIQYWKFKDNNILFFLCASKFCNLFNEAQSKYSNPDNDESLADLVSPLKQHLDKTPLHPVIIEFILDKIEHTRCSSIYVGFIQELIRNEIIINIPTKEELSINFEKIKADILFSIIYIHFNKTYNEENRHCFKRLAQYFSFIKHIDKNIASVIRRYYRKISVIDAEFRGINFKGYNLSYSLLKNVKFYRCKIDRTIFEGNCFNNVLFNLCYIVGLPINRVLGDFTFKCSELLHIDINVDNNGFSDQNPNKCIEFSNCILDQVFISSKLNKISVSIKNCDIRQLQFNCKGIDIRIENCFLSKKVSLKNTDVHSLDGSNNIIKGKAITDIRKMFESDQGTHLYESDKIIKETKSDTGVVSSSEALIDDNSIIINESAVDEKLKTEIKSIISTLCKIQELYTSNGASQNFKYILEIEKFKAPLFYLWENQGLGDFTELSSECINKSTYDTYLANQEEFLRNLISQLQKNSVELINDGLKETLIQLYSEELNKLK